MAAEKDERIDMQTKKSFYIYNKRLLSATELLLSITHPFPFQHPISISPPPSFSLSDSEIILHH